MWCKIPSSTRQMVVGLQKPLFSLRICSSLVVFTATPSAAGSEGYVHHKGPTLQIKLKLITDFAEIFHPVLCRSSDKKILTIPSNLNLIKRRNPHFWDKTSEVFFTKSFLRRLKPLCFSFLKIWKYRQFYSGKKKKKAMRMVKPLPPCLQACRNKGEMGCCTLDIP